MPPACPGCLVSSIYTKSLLRTIAAHYLTHHRTLYPSLPTTIYPLFDIIHTKSEQQYFPGLKQPTHGKWKTIFARALYSPKQHAYHASPVHSHRSSPKANAHPAPTASARSPQTKHRNPIISRKFLPKRYSDPTMPSNLRTSLHICPRIPFATCHTYTTSTNPQPASLQPPLQSQSTTHARLARSTHD